MIKLADMKRTAAEKNAEKERWDSAPDYGEEDYGICIRLDGPAMKKLGIKDMPKPGDEFTIEAIGRVTESEESLDESGPGRRHIEIVLQKMGCEPKGGNSVREDIERARAAKK